MKKDFQYNDNANVNVVADDVENDNDDDVVVVDDDYAHDDNLAEYKYNLMHD